MSRAFEIVLEQGGAVAVLAELTPSQLLLAAKRVGREPAETVRLMKLARHAAEMSFVSLDGDTSEKAKATLLGKSRYASALGGALHGMYTPTIDELAAVEAMSVKVRPDGELWTLRLPCVGDDGQVGVRVIELGEVGPPTVDEAIREAEMSAGGDTAIAFLSQITGPARSIRTIDGAPVSLSGFREKGWAGWDAWFSVRETYVLGAAFARIHGSNSLGEVTPVVPKG